MWNVIVAVDGKAKIYSKCMTLSLGFSVKTPIPRGDKWHLALARISGSSCAAADTFYHFDYRWRMSSFLFHINWEYTVLTKNVDCGSFPTCWGGINYPVQCTEGFQQKHPPFYLFLFPWSVLTPATHQESFTKYIKIKYKKNIHTFVQCALEHITDLSDLFKNGIGNRLNKGVGSKMFVWGIWEYGGWKQAGHRNFKYT